MLGHLLASRGALRQILPIRPRWHRSGLSSRWQEEIAVKLCKELKKEFWSDLRIPGDMNGVNTELEKATRVADFIELGELIALDALQREESCGGHFREEYQTADGEALRNDNDFMFVGAWEYKGEDQTPELHKETLNYEAIEVKQRDYK